MYGLYSNGDDLKMRKETVEVDERYGKEYAGKYVFQEITWAKRNRILQKYTRYNPQTGSVVTTDYVAIQAETVFASLVEQPENKPITLEKMLSEAEDGLPITLGELLSKTANKLTIMLVEETKNF
jgi:hypothetical protein